MKRGRILDMIIAIFAGVAIWAYVISVLDPVDSATIRSVPVQLINVESMQNAGLAIAGAGEYTVDVVVGGNRSNVSNVTADDFIATADVSGLRLGQNYITVEITAPANLSVTEVRTQNIQVYVDTAVSVEKDITLKTVNLADGTELGSVSCGIQTVRVSGAQSLVDTVAGVNAMLDVSEMTVGTVSESSISLVPVDAEGERVVGVSLSDSSVAVKASLYRLKEVALNVPIEGELNDHISVRSEIIPASVVVKGPDRLLSEIWQIDAEPVDKSLVTESCSISLTLVLPEGIEIANASKNVSVDYEIKGRVEKSVTISPDGIVFMNVGEGLDVEFNENTELILSVYEDEYEALTSDSVSLIVDLAGITAGDHSVEYSLIGGENLEDVLLVEGPETLNIRVF